jgi:hypothetical protein
MGSPPLTPPNWLDVSGRPPGLSACLSGAIAALAMARVWPRVASVVSDMQTRGGVRALHAAMTTSR